MPDAICLALLASAHVATGWEANSPGNLAGAVSLFWPPTGIAVAAAIVFGRRGIAACGVAAFVTAYLLTKSASFAVGAAVANAIEAAIAASIFRRSTAGRIGLSIPADAGALFVAGAIGAVFAASIGTVGVVILGHEDTSAIEIFATWWLGDMAGLVLFAPPILSFAAPVPNAPPRVGGGWSAVSTCIAVALAVALAFVPFDEPPRGLPFALVQIVAVVFATFRFGTRGAHLAALLVGVACFFGTLAGLGPFAFGPREHSHSVLWAAIVLFGGEGLFVASIVAERVDAEFRLTEGERRLQALFEHAPNGMLLIDTERRIVLANPEARKLAGRDDIEGRKLREVVDPQPGKLLVDALRRGAARGERIIEARIRRTLDGVDHDLIVRTSVLGHEGRFDGAVVMIEDVTEREQERREHEEMEQQLAAAQRLESIGNLAGGIAHDFNNMLQAIRANLELAELYVKKGKDVGSNIERALGATDRASALTRQLLAFSRRQPARFDRVDLVETIRAEMALLERLLPEDIHLVFDPGQHDAWARGDHAQLEQVVLNLVVNARDAMPNGGELRIAIETQRFDESENGLVRISVTDQGPGVDPGIRDRIFEPFFTTKPTGRGTGLGLAVVYGIVKSHGGSVHVENAPGGGSRFVVELPWMRRPDHEVDASEPEGEAPEGHGERILLVEDDVLVRTAVRDMLAASSYEVTVASNGAEAVAAYREAEHAFDVVILDVVMPVMGGREAYEQLRRLDPSVSVIFATGYSEEQIDVRFVLRERVPVVTKPYERAALLSAITQVVLAKRMADCDVNSAS